MKSTTELLLQLKSAAQEEIMCRETSDTSDAWQDLASPENVLALLEIALPVLEQQGNDKHIAWRISSPESGEFSLTSEYNDARKAELNGYEVMALSAANPLMLNNGEINKSIECPFPCGWKELLRISMSDGAFLAKNLIEGEEVKDFHRHAAINNTERLVRVISAMLETQPFTTPQIDNDGWIDWRGGNRPVDSGVMVATMCRNGACAPPELAVYWEWAHNNSDLDIIAYRVIENDGREG